VARSIDMREVDPPSDAALRLTRRPHRGRRTRTRVLASIVAAVALGACVFGAAPARGTGAPRGIVLSSGTTSSTLPRCSANDLRLSYTNRTYDGNTALRIDISTARRPCMLHGIWPQVDLLGRSGRGRFAKGYPYLAAVLSRLNRSAAAPRLDGTTHFAVRPGFPREVDLISTGTSRCMAVQQVTYYLTEFGGSRVSLTMREPISVCGSIYVLPFIQGETPRGETMLADVAATVAAKIAKGSTADPSVPSVALPYLDSAGFHYGTDTGAPTPFCHSTQYWVPAKGDCAYGYLGKVGMYAGSVGGWQDNYGCGTAAYWLTSNANQANTNLTTYSVGEGAAGYYHAGGAQRDYYYNGTESEADSWGMAQASNADNLASNYPIYSGFLMIDIETSNAGYVNDGYGWNSGGYPTSCSLNPTNDITHPDLNNDVVTSFRNWLKNNTSYFTAYYSAGGSASSGANAWANIMGSNDVTATPEWTFTQQHGDASTGPSGWTLGSYSAQWFGNAPANCRMMWQWTAGGSSGDYDQVHDSVVLDPCW
jgi:hypothetical protein